jgi:RNA polymerase sigma-70 factor (ECF subfamily)
MDSQNSSIAIPLADCGAAAGKSNPSALEQEVIEFFEELRAPLLRYVLSFGLRTDDGEEIAQEVFIALFKHLRQGKSRTNLKGWIFRVGHNLALKQRKRNGRRNRIECTEVESSKQISPALNPEQHMVRSQYQDRLLEIVESLPDLDRCCLYLRAEGLRYREIAEVLDISLGGVSLALSRALSKLMEADRIR